MRENFVCLFPSFVLRINYSVVVIGEGKILAKKSQSENKLVCNSTSNKENMVDSQEITPVMSILTHSWARKRERAREPNSKQQLQFLFLWNPHFEYMKKKISIASSIMSRKHNKIILKTKHLVMSIES